MQLPTFRAPDDALLVAMLARALAQPGGAPPAPRAVIDRDACRHEMASAREWARHHRSNWRRFDAVAATKATAATPRKAEPPSATPATAPRGAQPRKAEQAPPTSTGRSVVATQGQWVSALFAQQPGKFTAHGNPILGAIMAATTPAG